MKRVLCVRFDPATLPARIRQQILDMAAAKGEEEIDFLEVKPENGPHLVELSHQFNAVAVIMTPRPITAELMDEGLTPVLRMDGDELVEMTHIASEVRAARLGL